MASSVEFPKLPPIPGGGLNSVRLEFAFCLLFLLGGELMPAERRGDGVADFFLRFKRGEDKHTALSFLLRLLSSSSSSTAIGVLMFPPIVKSTEFLFLAGEEHGGRFRATEDDDTAADVATAGDFDAGPVAAVDTEAFRAKGYDATAGDFDAEVGAEGFRAKGDDDDDDADDENDDGAGAAFDDTVFVLEAAVAIAVEEEPAASGTS